MAQLVKNPPEMWEIWVQSLAWEDPLKKRTLPTPVFWPGKFHGLFNPWGHKESDTTQRLSWILFYRSPSPVQLSVCVQSFLTLLTPWTVARQAPLPLGILQARILDWSGLPFFLQGIFPSQGLNPDLLHCRRILYQLSHKGSPRILERVAGPSPGHLPYSGLEPLSRASPASAGGFFTSSATFWDDGEFMIVAAGRCRLLQVVVERLDGGGVTEKNKLNFAFYSPYIWIGVCGWRVSYWILQIQVLCLGTFLNPRWLSGKESSCPRRSRGFHPRVRKMSCRRKWQPAPVFLPGESRGRRSLVGSSARGRRVWATSLSLSIIPAWRIPWMEEPGGLQPVGSQRVGHNWATEQQPCVLVIFHIKRSDFLILSPWFIFWFFAVF